MAGREAGAEAERSEGVAGWEAGAEAEQSEGVAGREAGAEAEQSEGVAGWEAGAEAERRSPKWLLESPWTTEWFDSAVKSRSCDARVRSDSLTPHSGARHPLTHATLRFARRPLSPGHFGSSTPASTPRGFAAPSPATRGEANSSDVQFRDSAKYSNYSVP